MPDLQSRLVDAHLLAVKGDYPAAIDAYERLLAEIDRGARFFAEAEARDELARLYHEVGDPLESRELTKLVAIFQREGRADRAVDACLRMAQLNRHSATASLYWADRAVKAAERGGDAAALGRALASRGQLLLAFERVEDAIATLERATALPGGERWADSLASARLRVGRADDLLDALAEAERSDDDESARRALHLRVHLADSRRAAGDRAGALELLRAAADEADASGEGDVLALVMDRIGLTLIESGDGAAAADALERGIERVRAAGRADDGQLASLYNNLGNALTLLGNEPGAARAYAGAARLAKGVGALKTEALSQFGLANAAARAGALDASRDAYDEARSLARRIGDRSLEAACLDSLGQIHTRAGRPAMAVEMHREAASLHAEVGDHEHGHIDLVNLAQAHFLLGRTADARRAIDEAREVAARGGHPPLWQHALMEGQVLAREGRWPDARAVFESAIVRLEGERARLATPSDQRRWAAKRVEAFEISVHAAFEAGDALAALRWLEANRARFLDAVADRRRRLPRAMPDEARSAYAAAADRVAELRWRRRERPDAPDAALDRELDEATTRWRALDAEVERLRMAEEAHGVVAREPIPDVVRLASALSPGEAAVAIHATPNWLGAACIGRARDGETWWASATDDRLTLADLSRLVVGRAEGDGIETRPAWRDLQTLSPADAQQLVARACATLGDALWPLVERVVGDRADALVLMPGRGLNVLPLHAAPTGDGRRALDRWSLRYAPSLALLAGAGPPGALPSARRLGQVVNPTGDLPFAEPEAAAIRTVWRGEAAGTLHGGDAEPDRVLPLFRETDVLHFAGHGAFDAEDPLRSRLRCAPGADGASITLQMLLERVPSLRTRVVLLSACETGRVVAGDPLNDQLGLPGALLIAGASAVLATFWHVDDLATCLVLARCIETWEAGEVDLDRALAEAQEWLRTRATAAVVRDWIEQRLDEGADPAGALEAMHGRLVVRGDEELLFREELYWAAFHVTGRAVLAA